jgi:hypothetical protein
MAIPAAPMFLPRKRRYVMGVDLGQSFDPTAIAVIEHVTGVLDFNPEWERHGGCGTIPQKPAERMNVRHLERLPLGKSYPSIVEKVRGLLAEDPLCGDAHTKPAELLIDETGVGRAVADIFNGAGLQPIRVSITAGSELTCAGAWSWHVAKTVLISTVDAALHTGTLRFADRLHEAAAMREELRDFRRHLSDAGRATYMARAGAHDDLVLAVAIACWWAGRKVGVIGAGAGRY